MAATATSHKDKQIAWVEENPLRVWRKKQQLSMTDVASGLDVAFSSVQQWEGGGYFPNEESMVKIAGAMGVSHAALERKWTAWYDRRPKL